MRTESRSLNLISLQAHCRKGHWNKSSKSGRPRRDGENKILVLTKEEAAAKKAKQIKANPSDLRNAFSDKKKPKKSTSTDKTTSTAKSIEDPAPSATVDDKTAVADVVMGLLSSATQPQSLTTASDEPILMPPAKIETLHCNAIHYTDFGGVDYGPRFNFIEKYSHIVHGGKAFASTNFIPTEFWNTDT